MRSWTPHEVVCPRGRPVCRQGAFLRRRLPEGGLMTRIREWFRRIAYLLNRGRVEAALEEEMNAHRAMMGEPARFGNRLQLRERARDVWGWNWLDGLVRDLRFAARGLRRTPVFTIVVILSLALGFALTTTVVAVVSAYLLRTL